MDTKDDSADDSLRRELAHKIGCITVDELAILANAKHSTIEAWAKRGRGPAYAILGNTKLIPLSSLESHVAGLVRERVGTDPKGLL